MKKLNSIQTTSFSIAFNETNPVLLGYIPLGIAFGVLFNDAGFSWFWAVGMSIFVYAGAAQFMIVPLLLENTNLFDIAIVTLLLNLRHIFYGLSFIDNFSKIGVIKRNYMIFGLSDEAYSILTTSPNSGNQVFCFYVIFLCHLYWITGTIAGTFLGNLIEYDLSFLSFSLVALFVILTIEQGKKIRSGIPFIVAGVSCLFAFLLFPQHMLIVALTFSIVGLGISYKYART